MEETILLSSPMPILLTRKLRLKTMAELEFHVLDSNDVF